MNAQTREFLQKKVAQLHTQATDQDAAYEADIGTVTAQMEAQTEARAAQLALLTDLRERRQVELDQQREDTEARELEARLAKEGKAMAKRQNLASRCIQSTLRAYMKRKAELEALAPKKKGKGDKKGKKKK